MPEGAASYPPKYQAQLQTVLEIVRRLASEPRLDPLLESIAAETCNLLDAERATLFLYDPATNELYSRVVTQVEVEEIRIPVSDQSIAGAAANTKGDACLNIADVYADPRFNRGVDLQTGWRTRNILAASMRNLDGELVGVLEALNKRGGGFTEEDCSLIRALGAQAGVALERARLLEEFLEKRRLENEMQLARDIQIGLQPQSAPEIQGFDLAGWSQPSEYAGGDFFDLFPWGDGRAGLMLGDAVGHGVGPALLAAETRALVRALALHEDRPDKILSDANRLLSADVSEGRFVTLLLALADGKAGIISYASAGQGPLFVLRAGGASEQLGSTGLPLGILAEAPISCGPPVALAPGEALLVASDGIFECETRSGDLGVEPALQEARRHLGGSADDLIRSLKDLTERVSPDGKFRDDRTIVVAKRIG
jgi:phosphoserine phosphatase